MPATVSDGVPAVPTYAAVLRTRAYLPVFLVASLSTWGDYIARITIAAVVYQRTNSAFATAATFAVSLLPTIFGRGLLSPLADRMPYKYVLIACHLIRAALVVALIAAVAATAPVPALLALLFVLELVGGPSVPASQILLTDLFRDRRMFAKAFALNSLSEQINQAVGLAIGGAVVALLGAQKSLLFDLATFLVAAAILAVVLRPSEVQPSGARGLSGLVRETVEGARHLVRNRLLISLLALSTISTLGMTAPEAVAIPYAEGHHGSGGWGGFLMAAPILGAVVGLLLLGRRPAVSQNRRMLEMALITPLPLLVTVVEPPLAVVWASWFVCGCLQSFMLPLQSTFSLLVPAHLRGRVFGLAGAVSVAASGCGFLIAGYIGQHTTPAAAVGVCAVTSLGGVILLAARWPRQELAVAVEQTYSRVAAADRASA